MHRATAESGLTESADGSIARRAEKPLRSATTGGRHVGLTNSAFSWKFATRSQRPSNGKDSYFRGYAGRNRSVCCLRYVAS